MDITVIPGRWGTADTSDVAAVVRNVIEHLDPHLLTLPAGCIQVVSRPDTDPEIAYRASPHDPYRMFVNASDRRWARLAYQVAHEYCHIVSGYERLRARGNQWFHESLCATASFFCLLQMADSWQASPPFAHWSDYAVHLKSYAEAAINDPNSQLPAGKRLKDWLAENVNTLRQDPYVRDLNRVVASQLLPQFLRNPASWECVAHLPNTDESFEQFLASWRACVPAEYGKYVDSIAGLFV